MRRFLTSSLKITLFLLFVVFLLPLLFLWSLSVLYNGATDYEALGAIFLFAVASSIIFFIPLYIAGMILNIVRGKVVGREWIITSRLERLWPQIVGYRQYVQMVEREKLEFQTKQMAEVSKNDTLPYAVALGFVKNWKKIIS